MNPTKKFQFLIHSYQEALACLEVVERNLQHPRDHWQVSESNKFAPPEPPGSCNWSCTSDSMYPSGHPTRSHSNEVHTIHGGLCNQTSDESDRVGGSNLSSSKRKAYVCVAEKTPKNLSYAENIHHGSQIPVNFCDEVAGSSSTRKAIISIMITSAPDQPSLEPIPGSEEACSLPQTRDEAHLNSGSRMRPMDTTTLFSRDKILTEDMLGGSNEPSGVHDISTSDSDHDAPVWSNSPRSSDRSGTDTSGSRQDSSTDNAVTDVLLERCSKILAAVEAQVHSHNPVIKESLVSLLRSLELQRHLLLQRQNRALPSDPSYLEPQAPVDAATHAHVNLFNAPPDHCHIQEEPQSAASCAVESMRTSPAGGAGLAGVVGLQEVKQVLQEAFVWPRRFPQLFQGEASGCWSRLLLYGPPGTGKTRLARALAQELCCPLYTVTPSALLSSWLGDSEKIVRELFSRARSEAGPVIVFMDEMDALCRTRTHAEDDSTRRIKTELLVHMDNDRRADTAGHHGCKRNFTNFTSTTKDHFTSTNNSCHVLQEDDGISPSKKLNSAKFPHLMNSFLSRTVDASIRNENNNRRGRVSSSDEDIFFMSDEPHEGSSVYPGMDSTTHGTFRSGDQNDETGGVNQLFVIAATNCPWHVDPAFLRRFQRRCYVALPNGTERRALLEADFAGRRVELDAASWQEVISATEGYSGADLGNLATTARCLPIRELHSARYWQFTDDNLIMPCSSDTLGAMQYTLDMLPSNRVTVRPVRLEDILAAARATPRSVPSALLQQYADFSSC
ncbi:uncharacterized protein LOC108683308 isoform X1 [Hyalella azteca]|uniref:Uncharacterized protein LOC108683308 isoform X1 n=1 Tax=Hyalella azteca TaxID=294128 RepID=A0A8B7PSC9_HYAAZ|nr:uncharacterized protein LOC108683308 isoform X1 [Hyalella azteca]